MMPSSHPRFPRCLPLLLILCGATAADAADFPKDFAAFQAELSPAISGKLDATPKHYRQIEPSLFHLCLDHADRLSTLSDDERLATVVKLAEFIDRKRDATGELVVIGADRTMIGLLDPARRTGFTPLPNGYISKCQLCYHLRHTLYHARQCHKWLGPAECYPSCNWLSPILS
jgi:hypothetical protein